MEREQLGTEVLWREWDQAWTQSRHLETMRSQYLGFFFTALLATIAIVAGQAFNDSLSSSASLASFSGLTLGLNVLAAFLYLAVVRMNAVLWFYMQVIFRIRAELASRADPPMELEFLNLLPTPPRGRVSTVAKAILGSAVVVAPVALAAGFMRAITLDGTSRFVLVTSLIATLASLMIAGLVVWGQMPDNSIEYAKKTAVEDEGA